MKILDEVIYMENQNIPQDILSEARYNITENYIYEYKDLLPELADDLQKTIEETMAATLKMAVDEAIATVRRETPAFKDIPFEQLKDNKDFQQVLKEYMLKNPPAPPTAELLKSIIPKKHIKPNTKLANTIAKNLVNDTELELIVSNRNAKKEVTTKVMLNYENKNVQLISQVKFTPYDREVYDGVTSLYEAGNNVILPSMVYRAMNGLTETEYIKPEALLKIKESIDKSRFIKTVIDYTDEAKLYNQKIDKTIYEGYLLACNKIIVESGGTRQEAYRLLDKPILYEYSQLSGQIISVPINLLNTKDTVYSTDEVIVIRGYLLRQIEWMKNEKSHRSTNITYQGVYEELEVTKDFYNDTPYKKKTAKVRGHVKSILESWQAQNYINNFEEYKEGKQIAGVKIHL